MPATDSRVFQPIQKNRPDLARHFSITITISIENRSQINQTLMKKFRQTLMNIFSTDLD